MADSKRSPRRAARPEKTPERVQNAAQAMYTSSVSGVQRGYVPQNTGGYRAMPPGAAPGQQPGYRTGSVPYAQAGQNTGAYNPQTDYSQRGYTNPRMNLNPAPKTPKRDTKKRNIIVISVLLVLGALAAGGLYLFRIKPAEDQKKEYDDLIRSYQNYYCEGVYVDGIPLGGMTPEQAMNSVQSQIRQRNDAWQVTLTYNGQPVTTINASMLGMQVDPAETLNEAWMPGHNIDGTQTPEQQYEEILVLKQEPQYFYTSHPGGNTAVIDSILEQIKQAVDRPAADAQMIRFDPSLPEPFVYQDEVVGLSLNIAPLKEQLYRMVSTMESGTVEIIPDQIAPNVRKVDLQHNYLLRSSVYTPIDSHSTPERNDNIRRAFSFINGYVLEPGATFRFNRIVGKRTTKNGYYPAIEYAYGEHVEGIGGGVCQASSTVYQAAVCAGLEIIKREPHSDSVSYTDYGKDATVSWTDGREVDLVFKNNTEGNLYFVALVTEDPTNKNRLIAKVMIYGMDMGGVRYDIKSEIVEVLPAPFEPKYIKDKDGTYVTYTDQEEVVSKAKEGYIVKSYRIEYTNGVQTGVKDLYTDRYEPKPERIYVGVTPRY